MRQSNRRFSYTIAHEPVDHLTLAVPRALAAAGQIHVSCDGKPLSVTASADDLAGDDATAPAPMRVALPEARIGTCELVVNYSVPLAALAPGQTIAITLPLVMPKDGKLLANNLTVRAERDLIAWPQQGRLDGGQ